MNIRNNIMNYLLDRDYVICTYENYVYIYKYESLENFSDERITLGLKTKKITIKGTDLTIVKITKDEISIKGCISAIEMTKRL